MFTVVFRNKKYGSYAVFVKIKSVFEQGGKWYSLPESDINNYTTNDYEIVEVAVEHD